MDFIENLGVILSQNIYIGFIVALIAGFVSSFSPCTLSTLPLIIGYVSVNNEKDNKKKGLIYSLFFCLGIIITFTILGIVSVVVGEKLRVFGSLWYIILAVILTLVSLQLFGVFKIKNKENICKRPKLKRGILGAFFLGILGGIFDSPCSTPALLAILAFASSQGNIIIGALLMIVYSLGHCVIMIIAGTSVDMINKIAGSAKYKKIGNILKIVFGILILFLALYLFYIAF